MHELRPEQTLEREITGAEVHRYEFDLRTDEFFQVHVEQKGVDVTLQVLGAGGKALARMDSPNGKEGAETLTFVSPRAGRYTLEVSSFDAKAEKGSYTIRREASRTAIAQDRRRVEVERVFVEGVTALGATDQPELAINKLEESLLGWRELQDAYMVGMVVLLIKQLKEAQNRPDVRPLTFDNTIERQLKTGELQAYSLDLKQGQVLRLDVEEKGIDIGLVVGRLDRQESVGRTNLGSGYGRETLTYMVEQSGPFLIVIRSPSESPSSGSYKLTAHLKSNFEEIDREQIAAEKLLVEGLELGNRKTPNGFGEAIRKWQAGLALWQKIGEKYWEAYSLYLIGIAQMKSGGPKEAIETLNRSLPLWQAANAKHDEAETQQMLATLYVIDDKPEKSAEALKSGLALMLEVGDHKNEAYILIALAALYEGLAEKEKATVYGLAASFSKDFTNRSEMLTDIGVVSKAQGNFSFAIEAYQLGLIYAKAEKNKLSEANLHRLLAGIDLELERYQDAEAKLNLALQLYRELKNKEGIAASLGFLSEISLATGERKRAAEYADQALSSADSDITILIQAGKAYSAIGEQNRALPLFTKALLLAKRDTDFVDEAAALNNLMLTWRALGSLRLAVYYGKQAVNTLQARRSYLKAVDQGGASISFNQSEQKAFLKAYESIYKQLAELLIENDRPTEAQEVLFFLKDQQLIDFNKSDTSNLDIRQLIRGQVSDPNSNQNIESRGLSFTLREKAAAERYVGAGGRLAEMSVELRTGGKQISELDSTAIKRLDAAVAEFAAALRQTETDFSQAPSDKDKLTDLSTLRELQSALRDLNQQTGQRAVAIYTLIGQERFCLLLVTPDSIKPFASPIKAEALNEKVLQFYAVLQSPAYDPRPLGKQLYDIILKPVEAELKKMGAHTLLWALDGKLRYVPMAALSPDGKGYLVEQYQNVVFTRADRERMTRPVSANWTGTGFGSSRAWTLNLFFTEFKFSRLPGVLAELQAIFDTNPKYKGPVTGTFFTDAKFTKNAFYEAMKSRRPLVHISSHFAFRPGDSSRSFLLLGDGTVLSMDELKEQERLFEGMELLTLSACNTAAQRADADGLEIDGFAELAQRLGAAAVIATLWRVSDNSTPRLMSTFYRLRQQPPGMTKAEALRQAQLALLTGTMPIKPRLAQAPITKNAAATELRIVLVPPSGKRGNELRRSTGEQVYVNQGDAPLYRRDIARPYAHPYYWSPFVLFGNLR
jgi:CHAT domain-containing protein